MKKVFYLSDPLTDCLDIILWVDILNGEKLTSIDFVKLIKLYYSLN